MNRWALAAFVVLFLAAGCGRYYPAGVAGPHAPAARADVVASPTEEPSPSDTPSDSPSPTEEPSPVPSDTPVPTAEPTAAPTAAPTEVPTAAPTTAPTATPDGYLFTWSSSGSDTSPEILVDSPVTPPFTGNYWAALTATCSGSDPSLQMIEWIASTGSTGGAATAIYHGSTVSTYINSTGATKGRWIHIEASPDCSYTMDVRQA